MRPILGHKVHLGRMEYKALGPPVVKAYEGILDLKECKESKELKELWDCKGSKGYKAL